MYIYFCQARADKYLKKNIDIRPETRFAMKYIELNVKT